MESLHLSNPLYGTELYQSYHTVIIACWRKELLAFLWEESLQLMRCEVTRSQRAAEGCCWEGEFFMTALGRLIQKKQFPKLGFSSKGSIMET